jgi:hypothetical protein
VLAVLALFIQTTKADTTFDGSWSVKLDAKVFNNPDGSKAQPWAIQFPATVKNGVFHGEYGTKGKPFWYELSGQIESGTATLRADELTGAQKYNFTWSVISTDGVDGLHLTAESERKLGVAVATKVKEMLK